MIKPSEIAYAIRQNYSLPIAHSLLRSCPGDNYLASYPRSGSTWLRTIIAAVLRPDDGFEPEVFNKIIPGVSGRRLPLIWALPHPRLLHSHCMFRSDLRRAVYVVRDGRDAITSFYHYSVTRRGGHIPFPEWLRRYEARLFGPTWQQHVESWLRRGRAHLGTKLMVLKFEEMKRSQITEVQRVLEFLGINASNERLRDAVDASAIERARERESRETASANVDRGGNASFYRGGITGQWEEYFDFAEGRKFLNKCASSLDLAGYA